MAKSGGAPGGACGLSRAQPASCVAERLGTPGKAVWLCLRCSQGAALRQRELCFQKPHAVWVPCDGGAAWSSDMEAGAAKGCRPSLPPLEHKELLAPLRLPFSAGRGLPWPLGLPCPESLPCRQALEGPEPLLAFGGNADSPLRQVCVDELRVLEPA